MSESYDVFIKQPVHENLKRLKGSKKRAIEKFIDYLSDNPFEAGDFSESDEIGRQIYCKVIKDYAIAYYPDHVVKEIKVIELVTTP